MLQQPPGRAQRSRAPTAHPLPSSPARSLRFAAGLVTSGTYLYAFLLARYFDIIRIVVRRPLVIFFRNGGLGDILCTLPTAARIASNHPTAYTIYCTHPNFVTLPKSANLFNRVIGIKMSDLVASLISTRHAVYRFNYFDEKTGHVSISYLADEFAHANGLPAALPWPELNLGALAPDVAELSLDSTVPVICIHTGPTWQVREWPLTHWDEFVSLLRGQMNVRILQIGASRHFTEGARFERSIKGAEDLRDRFSLLESLQIISRANLVVGIDSGLIHCGVALNIPVLGLFGATSAKLRLPQRSNVRSISAEISCLGCHHQIPRLHWQAGCPNDVGCMKDLSPARVAKEAVELLLASRC